MYSEPKFPHQKNGALQCEDSKPQHVKRLAQVRGQPLSSGRVTGPSPTGHTTSCTYVLFQGLVDVIQIRPVFRSYFFNCCGINFVF